MTARAAPLALADLDTSGDEPRVKDVRIGERLGMAQPLDIRRTIRKNAEELRRYGPIRTAREMVRIGSGAVRRVLTYYLNEAQALLLCMLSRTPRAADVRQEVIAVFMAWRRGTLVSPARLSAQMNHAVAAIAARDSQIARLEQREAQLLSIVERLSGRA